MPFVYALESSGVCEYMPARVCVNMCVQCVCLHAVYCMRVWMCFSARGKSVDAFTNGTS